MRQVLTTWADTERLAAACAVVSGSLHLVFLKGPIGIGKTAWVTALLRSAGYQGSVKSPTFTFVEPYEVAGRAVHHLDLYRLVKPEELEYLGVEGVLDGDGLVLIEWPERAAGALPVPDLVFHFSWMGDTRTVTVDAMTAAGRATLPTLERGLAEIPV